MITRVGFLHSLRVFFWPLLYNMLVIGLALVFKAQAIMFRQVLDSSMTIEWEILDQLIYFRFQVIHN